MAENAKGKNLVGGILKLDKKDIWHINQSANYVNHQKEDWVVLSDFWNELKQTAMRKYSPKKRYPDFIIDLLP